MNIFCGAGLIGRKSIHLWKECGLKADFFLDNNSELWETEIEGVCVKSFEEIALIPEDSIFYITCNSVDIIREQLLSLGIWEEKIKDCSDILIMFGYAMQQPEFKTQISTANSVVNNDSEEILFDLQNGLMLGGVESWSIQTSHRLRDLGWKTGFLLNGLPAEKAEKDAGSWSKENLVLVKYREEMSVCGRIVHLSNYLVETGCRNMIVNFVGHNLVAACLAKKNYPDKVKVIAVLHNDEDVYYAWYRVFEKYIDRFFFISQMIKDRMLKCGFPENKLEYLPWEIDCEEKLTHAYTISGEPLRIGYAGRIEVRQKRLDRMVAVVKKLKEMRIHFRLELAGSGSYEEELKKQIKEDNLENEMRLVGLLDPVDISGFWERQDIMVSCSDWEGHSISQGEAMANGVVPVVTDVSGVRDDVTDGENGFIVEVGSVEQVVEKIVYLYEHRELLPIMGEKAHQTILINNNAAKLERQWQDMLI